MSWLVLFRSLMSKPFNLSVSKMLVLEQGTLLEIFKIDRILNSRQLKENFSRL